MGNSLGARRSFTERMERYIIHKYQNLTAPTYFQSMIIDLDLLIVITHFFFVLFTFLGGLTKQCLTNEKKEKYSIYIQYL